MASTSTKLVGGLSAKDASIFAREMFCEAEFLQGMRKYKDHTEFACFVRNYTPCPLRLTVQFGQMESRPRIGEAERQAFLEGNRKRFAGGETMSPVHQTSSDPTDYDIEESDLL